METNAPITAATEAIRIRTRELALDGLLEAVFEDGTVVSEQVAVHRTIDGAVIVYTPTHLYHIGSGGAVSATPFGGATFPVDI